MNKVTYYIAALILGFSMSAQAQGARAQFKPSYAQEEVEAANEMSAVYPTQTMSQRAEVLNYRTIPNPWVTLEPTLGYISSNFTGIEGRNGSSAESVSRLQAGATVLIGRGMWQGETGLFYSPRGAQMTVGATSGGKNVYDFNLTYLDIPLMARFSWPHSSKSHFFARAGVVVGILSEAKYDVNSTIVTYGATTNYPAITGIDAKDYFNATDLRGAFGAGYDWKFSNRVGMVLQADLQESFSKINTDKFLNDLDVYNFGIIVSAGVSIKL
ncbi:PorT family protein [Bdellovibrio sp. SKB1291214]|uniref:outer membrane beta-barrel protein n=1 Tax=Bdellovibrio sp. SKB1291214 TaxID=1732569 RepID=UPI000B51D414|nr:outer membrane beta-barrel protein [Bdellovibrio sp. SKB1291214]UYL09980.1 PorT family protein [Bdellovibrio sp. SKB1291214]